MKQFRSQHWQLDLPIGWQTEEEEEAVCLYNPDSNGTLTISATREDQNISDEYIEELLADHLDAGAELIEVELGAFSGVSFCYDDNDEYWCEWYLRNGPVLLFITYNCPLDEEGSEDDVIESILESLKLISKPNLH